MSRILVTYEPDNSLRRGYFSLFKEIVFEIFNNKWLTFQLFKRDVCSLYKQSFVGIFWILIIPVISVGTFIVLNNSGVFSMGDINVPYPIFAILGMCFWQFFATGLVACANSLANAGQMITKINFSKKSLVIGSLGISFVGFFIQFLLVLILFFYYGFKLDWFIFLSPIFLLPIIFLTLGLGFILALLNGIMRDIANILAMSMTFFMFLTPVLYARPNAGFLATATRFNPMYYLINTPREFILQGNIVEVRGFVLSVSFSIIVFLLCLVFFHLTETRVSERV